jgi:hypothetical protein
MTREVAGLQSFNAPGRIVETEETAVRRVWDGSRAHPEDEIYLSAARAERERFAAERLERGGGSTR